MKRNFQPYTLKVFDAVLTIAYALHSMLEHGHSISKPQFQQVCYNETVKAWSDGELLLKHIKKVRKKPLLQSICNPCVSYSCVSY